LFIIKFSEDKRLAKQSKFVCFFYYLWVNL
jgi:hypothetical protein